MIKKNQRYFNWINRLTDMMIMVISYCSAAFFMGDDGRTALSGVFQNPLPLLIITFAIVVVFQAYGMYDSFRFQTIWSELTKLLLIYVLCFGIGVGLMYFLNLQELMRSLVVLAGALSYTLLAAKRASLRRILRQVRSRGFNQKHIIIVGDTEIAEQYLKSIQENPQYGFSAIGYVGNKENSKLIERLGSYDELGSVLKTFEPDEVVIALDQYEQRLMSGIIMTCEETGIRTSIVPAYNEFLPACASVDLVGGTRLINLRVISMDVTFNSIVKRVFDLVISAAALVVLSPLMLIIAAAVKLSGPGPVLFKQVRLGRNRKEFVMYKFRSMVVNDSSDSAWSKQSDSRVTAVGAIIRKLSLDELPQLFNVIKGDMSIVGPRPELPYFVEQYKYSVPRYMVKHQVKPGITGWAQVNGYRGDTSIVKRIEYDIWYIENWSILLDIKIVLKTLLGGMINSEKNLGKNKRRRDV